MRGRIQGGEVGDSEKLRSFNNKKRRIKCETWRQWWGGFRGLYISCGLCCSVHRHSTVRRRKFRVFFPFSFFFKRRYFFYFWNYNIIPSFSLLIIPPYSSTSPSLFFKFKLLFKINCCYIHMYMYLSISIYMHTYIYTCMFWNISCSVL